MLSRRSSSATSAGVTAHAAQKPVGSGRFRFDAAAVYGYWFEVKIGGRNAGVNRLVVVAQSKGHSVG